MRRASSSLRFRDGVPYSDRFNDMYYPSSDPEEDVRHTYLRGAKVDRLLETKKRVVVAETGFGTGLNFFETWKMFEESKMCETLDYISVEGFPIWDTNDLKRCHQNFPSHDERSNELIRKWPTVPGIHRIRLANGRVRLVLCIGDVRDMLQEMTFRADAWLLDGFNPKTNTEMWSSEVLNNTARLSKSGATLATYTVSRLIRNRLQEAGWQHIRKRQGFGRKRECLAASFLDVKRGDLQNIPWYAQNTRHFETHSKIAVIGNGVAAWSMMRSLRDSGFRPRLIGEHSNWTSSHLPVALICPKLVKGGGGKDAYRNFNRVAYLDAVRELEDLEGVWNDHRGVLIANGGNEDVKRHQLDLLESFEIEWIENNEIQYVHDASSRVGSKLSGGGLFLPRGGCIVPSRLREALICDGDDDMTKATVSSIQQRLDERFEITFYEKDEKKNEIFDVVVVATGAESSKLLPDFVIPGSTLRRSHGAVLTCRSYVTPPMCSVLNERGIGGGYITAEKCNEFVVGAAVSRNNVDSERDKIRLSKRVSNMLPNVQDVEKLELWNGIRSDTIDHLPMAGNIQDGSFFRKEYHCLRYGTTHALRTGVKSARYIPGLFVLTGLGSRGFQASFILADLVTSMISGRVLPMDENTLNALMPSRFQVRELMKSRVV